MRGNVRNVKKNEAMDEGKENFSSETKGVNKETIPFLKPGQLHLGQNIEKENTGGATWARHCGGVLVWSQAKENNPSQAGSNTKVVKTSGLTSRENSMTECFDRREEINVAGALSVELEEHQDRNDVVPANVGAKKKDMLIDCLHQGELKRGMPLSNPGSKNPGDVKVMAFTLSDKEKALKESFLKRQEEKKATKKLVHPTLLLPHNEQCKEPLKENVMTDNPVATAAAIAAAAASAASGPFLQLQHSLETQVAALVSSIQNLKQNQTSTEDLQAEEQMRKLQQQLETRLQRLEEAQKMLEVQTFSTGAVSSPAVCLHPSTERHPVHSATSLPSASSGKKTIASFHGSPDTSAKDKASNIRRGDVSPTEKRYPLGGQSLPYTTSLYKDDPRSTMAVPLSIIRPRVTFEEPSDPPFQTPLPRRQPPIPISRHDSARSRLGRHHADPGEAATVFQGSTFGLPSYKDRMTGKGHRLLEQLKPRSAEERDHGRSISPVLNSGALNSYTVSQRATDDHFHSETAFEVKEDGKTKFENIHSNEGYPRNSQFTQGGPAPLDEYLEVVDRRSPLQDPRKERLTGLLPVEATVGHHFADVEHILKDVQHQRQNLEVSFVAIKRKQEETDSYNVVDVSHLSNGSIEDFDGKRGMKKHVATKIADIISAMQREAEQLDNRTTSDQVDVSKQLNKEKSTVKNIPSLHGIRAYEGMPRGASDSRKMVSGKSVGKENVMQKRAVKKSKQQAVSKTQSSLKKSAKPTPAQRQIYRSSVYGKQSFQPLKTTSKAPYLHYHSPVNPKTAAVMAGLLAVGNSAASRVQPLQELPTVPVKVARESPARRVAVTSQKKPAKQEHVTHYFFHPATEVSQLDGVKGKSRIGVPVEGQLVPMAIPLGKPKTDPTLRPPVTTEAIDYDSRDIGGAEESCSDISEIQSPNSPTAGLVSSPDRGTPTRSNVALVSVRQKEQRDQTSNPQKKQRISAAKRRRGRTLTVQVLPPVDIDSLSESSSSTPSSLHTNLPTQSRESGGQEFGFYRDDNEEAVGTQMETSEQPEDLERDSHDVPLAENLLTLQGFPVTEDCHYTGPVFPPEHPFAETHPQRGILKAEVWQTKTLEENAAQWIEQELLACIMSETNQPVCDPTHHVRPQDVPESISISESDDGDTDVLASNIGLGGVQLFVDAGLTVDHTLVSNLIREVVEEKIATVLGHPQPTASRLPSLQPVMDEEHHIAMGSSSETPISTPTPTPDYTTPESEESQQEFVIVKTPEMTPTPSVTGEELSVEAEEENNIEPILETLDQEDKNSDQVCEVHQAVMTPIPTPPGECDSPVSLGTPVPSTQEQDEVERSTVVPTPQSSVMMETLTDKPETEPAPAVSVAEEPADTSSVSDKAVQQFAPHSVSDASSATTSTLSTTGTTTVTFEGELSEGEMIQPYIYAAGKYSEGEFPVSPGLLKLTEERKSPLDGDSTLLGRDEDSRNKLVRVAFNGILQVGGKGNPRSLGYQGSDSSSGSDSPNQFQMSSASTLKDTDDIKEDSVTDITQSEGELPFQDPMAILLNRIQQHMQSTGNSVSEGELLPEHLHLHHVPDQGQTAPIVKEGARTASVSGNVSPGEFPHELSAVSSEQFPLNRASHGNQQSIPRDIAVAKACETDEASLGELTNQDRSLHASDLVSGNLRTDFSHQTQHPVSKPKVVQVQGLSRQNEAASVDSDSHRHLRQQGPAVHLLKEDVPTEVQMKFNEGELEKTGSELPQKARIQVTLPSIDDIQQSSEESEDLVGIEQDTFGDVSSISGGEF